MNLMKSVSLAPGLLEVEDKVTYGGVDDIHFTVLSVEGMAVARIRIEYPVSDVDKKAG